MNGRLFTDLSNPCVVTHRLPRSMNVAALGIKHCAGKEKAVYATMFPVRPDILQNAKSYTMAVTKLTSLKD